MPNSTVSLLLGYSFGLANTPFSDRTDQENGTTEEEGNEPLVGIVGTVGRYSPFRGDVTLALANFGRLVSILKNDSSDSASNAADVRRSILADLTLRRTLGPAPRASETQGFHLYAALDAGFLFDAQGKEQGEVVPDASSYLLTGLSGRIGAGANTNLMMDLLVGQSEVMTGLDLFDPGWTWKYTRVRPRIRVQLADIDRIEGPSGLLDNVVVGIWADMGLDDRYGDTYALFISRSLSTFGK